MNVFFRYLCAICLSTCAVASAASRELNEHLLEPPRIGIHQLAAAPLKDWEGRDLSKDMPGFHASYFNAGEVTLYFAEGPDNGPPFLFIPALVSPWYHYQSVAKALAGKYHIYIVELRGHGHSGRPEDALAYSVNDYAKDVQALLDRVIGKPAYVAGTSLGGLITMQLGANAHNVAGVEIIDAPYFVTDPSADPRQQTYWPHFRDAKTAYDMIDAGASFEDVVRFWEKVPYVALTLQHWPSIDMRAIAVGRAFDSWLGKLLAQLPQAEAERYEKNWARYILDGKLPTYAEAVPASDLRIFPLLLASVARGTHDVLTGEWTFSKGFDHADAFRRLKVPTILWGSDHIMIGLQSPEQRRRAIELLSDGDKFEYVEAAKCTHGIAASCPELFVRETLQFFSR